MSFITKEHPSVLIKEDSVQPGNNFRSCEKHCESDGEELIEHQCSNFKKINNYANFDFEDNNLERENFVKIEGKSSNFLTRINKMYFTRRTFRLRVSELNQTVRICCFQCKKRKAKAASPNVQAFFSYIINFYIYIHRFYKYRHILTIHIANFESL